MASLIGLSGPTLGELQGGGTKEIASNTAGLTRFIDLLANDLQLPNDDQLSAWDGATGNELAGLASHHHRPGAVRGPGHRGSRRPTVTTR